MFADIVAYTSLTSASSARGNSSLESAVTLTKALRWDIQSLGQRLAKAANAEELVRRGGGSKAKPQAQTDLELKLIIRDIRNLLERIEDAVPLINLAITTSGASLSTTLPATISPSRLLQASTFLTAGDTQFSVQPTQAQQIGPAFTLSLYMLFTGHSRQPDDEGEIKDTTWKEVIHKANVKLLRVPLEKAYDLSGTDAATSTQPETTSRDAPSAGTAFPAHISGQSRGDEFAYQLLIIEDLEDDRVHSFDEGEAQPSSYEDVRLAGIREIIPIHEISKIFYADTGKILDIGGEGEANSAVLLLKRDVNAVAPRRMMERVHGEHSGFDEEAEEAYREDGDQPGIDLSSVREGDHPAEPVSGTTSTRQQHAWRLPPNLDPEWMAFEVYTEEADSDSEDDSRSESDHVHSSRPTTARAGSVDTNLTAALSSLRINKSPTVSPTTSAKPTSPHDHWLMRKSSATNSPTRPLVNPSLGGPVRTSLSLLETLIRLTALQQFQQTSHLSITDELLNFFLSESSTTGAGNDGEERRRKRWEARRRLGFDPYDDSPVKRRGERVLVEQEEDQDGYYQDEYEQYYYDQEEPRLRLVGSRKSNRTSNSPSPMLLKHRASLDRPTSSPPGADPSKRQHRPASLRKRQGSERSSPPSSAGSSRRLRPHLQPRPSVEESSPAASSPRSLHASYATPGGRARRSSRGVWYPVEGVPTKRASPLGRGVSVETDSTLGTSPGYDDDAPDVESH